MNLPYLQALEQLKTHTPGQPLDDDIISAHLKLLIALDGQKQYTLAKRLIPFLAKSDKTVRQNSVDVFAKCLGLSNRNELIPTMVREFLKDPAERLAMAEDLIQGSYGSGIVIERFLKPTMEVFCALESESACLDLLLRQTEMCVLRSVGFGEELARPDICKTLIEISQRYLPNKSKEIGNQLGRAWIRSVSDEDEYGFSADNESVETLHTLVRYGVEPNSMFEEFIKTGTFDEERAGNITQWLIEAGAKVQNIDLTQASPWIFDIVRTHPSYLRYMLNLIAQGSKTDHKPNPRPSI